MRIIAMYLPQFHEVKENSEWWGDGFTEWITVKNARPLYKGHMQPRHPYNGNYYDLLDRHTMEWQSGLMKQYGIDGICMYHYWFQDGRQILEKPAENLLSWKNIDMPFCFSWANETWARTWHSGKNENAWAGSYEKKDVHKGDGILLAQKYGDWQDWERHFYYLLPFFKDKRYIKVDGKPVFVFYKVSLISCFENMVDCWRELAAREGLDGLYLIGNACKEGSRLSLDEELVHEPTYAMRFCGLRYSYARIVDYDEIWEQILQEKMGENKTFGGFVGYDTTPRHGKNGFIISGSTPKKFKDYFIRLLTKNELAGSAFTFINAWNEWGEGMYLEPDEEYAFQYLEAVLSARQNYKRLVNAEKNCTAANRDIWREKYAQAYMVNEKDVFLRDIIEQWMFFRDKGIRVTDFLDKSIRTIAVYGYGLLGFHFLEETKHTDLDVKYIIDRKEIADNIGVKHFFPNDDLPPVDAVIVTAVYCYGEIYWLLKAKGIQNIISLEYLIRENIDCVYGRKSQHGQKK